MNESLPKNGGIGIIQVQGGMIVEVNILDYKKSYGRDRWRVSPVAGMGEAWVQNVLPHD